MIAVPSYPPKVNPGSVTGGYHPPDAGASIVLSTDGILSKLDRMIEKQPALKELQWVDVHAINSGYLPQWEYPAQGRYLFSPVYLRFYRCSERGDG